MKTSIRFSAGAILSLLCFSILPAQEAPPSGEGGPGPVDPARLLERFDANHDGRITQDEAPDRMRQRWSQIDTDNDGAITQAELEARDARVQGGATGPGGAAARPLGQGRPGGPPGGAEGPANRFQPAAPFSVITLGTGSPRLDPERSGPSTIIQHDGKYFLLDMGNGTQARLNEIGIVARQINALILTHHHLDHNEEFIPMFINTRLSGMKSALIGPPGTKRYVDFIMDFYAEDIAYRLGRRGQTIEVFKPIEVREVQGGESFDLDGMKVSTAKVNHTIHTVAFRFDVGGRSIVVSGDLSYSESLVGLAKGADVLVIDSGGLIVRKGAARRPADAVGAVEGGETSAEGARAHGTAQDVASMAAKAGVKTLVLTHIAPGEVDEAATLAAAKPVFSGEVVVGRDKLEVVPGKATPLSAVPATGGNTDHVLVKAGSTASAPDGRTWATAFPDVQSGLDAAAKFGATEVWVAAGTYKPTTGTDRSQSIRLAKGVALLGGFAGGETAASQRDATKNITVLSGDLGQAGVAADNSYNVVTAADKSVLDGFTITGGYAMDAGGLPGAGGGGRPGAGGFPGGPTGAMPPGAGMPSGPGGGAPIHITPQSVLSGPSRGSGAGLVVYQCQIEVRNCVFQGNQAGKGGAVYNMCSTGFPPRPDAGGAVPTYTNCRFLDNHARGRGGAVSNDLGTNPVFKGCTFIGNTCDGKGGAIYNDFSCSPTVANCLFVRNQASGGAAMGNDGASSPLVVHCTFAHNKALQEGAALYQGTGPSNNPVVVGCILWGDLCEEGPAEVFNWHDNDPAITGSCIQGGYPGAGNVAVDPQFLDPAQDDFRPRPGSPCVSMGHTVATNDDQLSAARAKQPCLAAPEAGPAKPHPVPANPRPILRVNARCSVTKPTGATWATAFPTLTEALAAAPGGAEIWVAAGTYRPTTGKDRAASFRLSPGIELYGGFAGTEERREQRDWKARPTILSGDIGALGSAADNCYHVLTGADNSVLDGFTVRDGCADGPTYDGKGGGMVNYLRAPQTGPMSAPSGFSPVVANCTFTANFAREGGAVYDYDRSTPRYTSCAFFNNKADYGGAMVARVGVRSVVSKCVFDRNEARWRAGAVMLDYGARPQFEDCRFTANTSSCHGGAMFLVSRASQLENTIAQVTNCEFVGNKATRHGGALGVADSAIIGLRNCKVEDNQAGTGGGAFSVETRGKIVLLGTPDTKNKSTAGAAGTFNDNSGQTSSNESDWPDLGSPQSAQGLGPPQGGFGGPPPRGGGL